MSIKVMLTDDHALMREGIKHLLEFDGSIKVIEEASDGIECLQKLEKIHPDILLLDINMPELFKYWPFRAEGLALTIASISASKFS